MTKTQVAKRDEKSANINVYQVFDALDDQQILDEIEGRITQAWVYDADGKIGVSKKGVDQCILEMAKQGWVFEELDVDVKADPGDAEYCLFAAKVQAFRYGREGIKYEQGIQIGNKRQWRKMKAKGSVIADPFWYEKGCAKAIRNAKMRFIPVEIEAAIVALSKKEKGRVKRVESKKTHTPNGQLSAPDEQDIAVEFEQPYAKPENGAHMTPEEKAHQDWTDRIPDKEAMLEEFLKASCKRFYSFMKAEYGYDNDMSKRKAEKILGLADMTIGSMNEVLIDADMRKDLNVGIWKEKRKVLFP